jgi:hypothetical protein
MTFPPGYRALIALVTLALGVAYGIVGPAYQAAKQMEAEASSVEATQAALEEERERLANANLQAQQLHEALLLRWEAVRSTAGD